jgi:hypothetical protein
MKWLDASAQGLEGEEKTTTMTNWGLYVAMLLMFGLKTTSATFQRIIIEIFKENIPRFM